MSTPESNKSDKPASRGTPKGSQAESGKTKTGSTRQRPGGGTIEKKEQPRKRISRRQRDEQNTKILYGVLGAAALIIRIDRTGLRPEENPICTWQAPRFCL
jgi:hypothetical protein